MTTKAKPDQRSTRRLALQLPVAVKLKGGPEPESTAEVTSQTKDVSARGVFFYLDSDVAAGSELEFTLTLPPEITLTQAMRVHCTGRVVRVDQSGGRARVGIAAAIDKYEITGES